MPAHCTVRLFEEQQRLERERERELEACVGRAGCEFQSTDGAEKNS